MQLAEINLIDRDTFVEGFPHELFTWLRANAPVFRHPEPDGPGFWVLSKHSDVVAVTRNHTAFSSSKERGGVIGLTDQESAAAVAASQGSASMVHMDPPEHTQYRRVLSRGFTPNSIRLLEPHIRRITDEILDDAIAKGEIDFVEDVAAQLPVQVIAELVGMPPEDRARISEWANCFVGVDDPEYSITPEINLRARDEMWDYLDGLCTARRKDPGPDLITTLLEAKIDGELLSELDIKLFFRLLLAAGSETTRNAINHGFLALLENPDQFHELVDDPELVVSATEEILRWASPVIHFRRNVIPEMEIDGHVIPAGDKVSLWYPSANRDEEVFVDPFRFDIHRSPNPHVAFGGGGNHFCLGASLARLEIQAMFDGMSRKLPELRAAGPPSYLRSNMVAGIKHLPVDFSVGRH